SNIDKVDIYGLEFNANAEIVEGWDIFGSINVTESEIKANASRPYTVGNKSPHTADYTINLGTQMVAPVATSFDLVMRADYRLTGPTWFHTVQEDIGPTLFSGLLPNSALMLPGFVGDADLSISERKAFGVLDLRVGLEGENWNITAFADNLLDERYLNEVITAVEFGGSFISPGGRRRFGVEVGYKF
ncbi:MAG: TonB-dependent receptor, partial [Parasphingorhabdus sp.]